MHMCTMVSVVHDFPSTVAPQHAQSFKRRPFPTLAAWLAAYVTVLCARYLLQHLAGAYCGLLRCSSDAT